MRNLAFILAGVLSLLAVVVGPLGWPRWVAIAALAVAFVFLALGFADKARNLEAKPKVLDGEQRATIARMKSEGNTPLAIQQVQLWFRNTSPEEAARIVREVREV